MTIKKATTIFFIFLHIILTLNFGFLNGSSSKSALISKLCSITQALSLTCYIYYLLMLHGVITDIPLLFAFAQTCLSSIILTLFSDKMSFYFFQKELESLDSVLGTNKVDYFCKMFVMACTITTWCIRIGTQLIVCFSKGYMCTFLHYVTSYHILHFDAIMMISFSIFFNAYCRLRILNRCVKIGGFKISDLLFVFKSLADLIERIKVAFEFWYVVVLMYKVPELLWLFYMRLRDIMFRPVLALSWASFFSLMNYIVLCIPAISVGYVSAETKSILVSLHENLLQERDAAQREKLQQFIEYVSKRPMQLRILRVLPLDWKLPLIILNVVISYQIIIVQLTHLY